LEAGLVIDSILASVAHAARSVIHGTFKTTPGALVFNRDMILDLPLVADIQAITEQRQHLIDKQTTVANRKRISHDYQPNEQVLVCTYNPDKLQPRAAGPYKVLQTHVNGTLTIERGPTVSERINIRRICPFIQ
jgi:hypothetical protein